jgi:hypothetical protein
MAHYERTEDCPEVVGTVTAGPHEVEIPDSGLIPVREDAQVAFAEAAEASGYFRKVDDEPVEDEAKDEAQDVPSNSDEPQSAAPVPDAPSDPLGDKVPDESERRGIFS